MLFDEDDQRGGNKQLVGDRIKKLPQIRDLISPSRKMPVKYVGERSCKKDRDRKSIAANAEPTVCHRRQKHNNKKRDNDDSCKSKVVW